MRKFYARVVNNSNPRAANFSYEAVFDAVRRVNCEAEAKHGAITDKQKAEVFRGFFLVLLR